MLKQILSITLAISLFSYYSQAADNQIYQVRSHDITPPVTLSGVVVAETEVTFTAQLPGRVEMVAGEEGDKFDANTILVALDDRQLLAKRRAAYAQWMRADAILRNAGMQFERQWRGRDSNQAPGGMGLPHLFDQFFTQPLSDLLGQSDSRFNRHAQLYNSDSKRQEARSAVLEASSQIEQIDAKLRDAQSRAPFDGIIVQKSVEMGDTVMMGQPLLKFSTKELQIEVNVPARLMPGLKVGKTVSASLDVLDERVIVIVSQIFPTADKQRHTVKVKFDLPIDRESEQGQYVGPGQYVQVDVPNVKATRKELLLIPIMAVKQRGSLPRVCVLNNNRYERRVVRLGQKINPNKLIGIDPSLGRFVTVLSGLKEGDQLILNKQSGKSPC
jgi:RND family efflux transporter MFP subunit